jgi:hypothetical protein
MSVNLLSLGQLDDNGLRFEFNNKTAKAFNKQTRKLIFTAKRINSRLYEISTSHTQQQALASSKVRASTDLEGWHRRPGHIGKDTIRQIHSINSINGLDINPSNTSSKICEPCQLKWIPTSQMIADDMTKSLSAPTKEKLRTEMGLNNATDLQREGVLEI